MIMVMVLPVKSGAWAAAPVHVNSAAARTSISRFIVPLPNRILVCSERRKAASSGAACCQCLCGSGTGGRRWAVPRGAAIFVKIVDEAGIVEPAQMMQIPKLHGIDARGIFVHAQRLLVDVGNGLHGRIELCLQGRRRYPIGEFGLFAIHLPALGVAALNDFDGFFRVVFEESD